MGRYVDLSRIITDGMPTFPGDDEVKLTQTHFFSGDGFNCHRLDLGLHSGTHIDAPMHISSESRYLSDYPISDFCGTAVLWDVCGQNMIDYNFGFLPDKPIVLLRTGWEAKFGRAKYFTTHPQLSMELAQKLVKCGIKMLGIDTPSPDLRPFEVHKYLSQNGVFILENLYNLGQIPANTPFKLYALPLYVRADGAPARVMAEI